GRRDGGRDRPHTRRSTSRHPHHGTARIVTIVGGILLGFVVWIGMYYAVLPAVGLSSMQNDASPGRAIAFHLIFSGAMTAAYFVHPRLSMVRVVVVVTRADQPTAWRD